MNTQGPGMKYINLSFMTEIWIDWHLARLIERDRFAHRIQAPRNRPGGGENPRAGGPSAFQATYTTGRLNNISVMTEILND